MRNIALAASALTLAFAAPALAQDWTADRPAVATTGSYAPTYANMPASHWEGSQDAWVAHVEACAKRYRTYDPTRDTYFSRPGVERRCALSMSIAATYGSPSEWTNQPPGRGAPTPADHSLGDRSGTIIGRQYEQN